MAHRLIVGEENPDISSMLNTYFEERGYHVQTVDSAAATLDTARTVIPSLVLVSTSLPDGDCHSLVQELRATPRISHVPIICLAARDRYVEMLGLLEIGADDCVAKPFDLEELALRVENAIARSQRENMTDPRSGLPGARLLDDHVRGLADTEGWTYLDLKIEHFEPFREVNGFVAADQVLHMMAGLLRDIVLAYGSDQDYVAHPADDRFVLITFTQDPDALTANLTARFDEGALAHYAFMDREMGFLTVQRGDEAVQVPLMTLVAAVVSPQDLYNSLNT